MKRLTIILTALLALVLPAVAQSNTTKDPATCHHYKVEVSQLDGKMQFKCDSCKSNIDYKNWKQEGDDFGFSQVDPFLNFDADIHDMGSQLQLISGTNSMKYLWVIRDADDKLLSFQDFSAKPSATAQITLPWYAEKCNLTVVALLRLMHNEVDDEGKSNMTYQDVFAVQHLVQKPFHRLYDLEVQEIQAADSDLVAHPFNRVKFSVLNPDDEDIQPEDMIIVYRAKKPDFSDAEVVTSRYLSDYNFKKDKLGWFYVDDKEAAAGYNTDLDMKARSQSALTHGADSIINKSYFSTLDQQILQGFYTHPSQPIYYMVTRALSAGLWPSHRGSFALTDSVEISKQLPSVSKVEIKPTSSWQHDKKSRVKITMANPLPWEYNELEDANLVQRYLQTEPLARRRYVWNEDALIRVRRYSPESEWYNGQDLAAMEYTIPGNKVTWNKEQKCWEAELTDCQALPYTHYYYSAIVEQGESTTPLAGNNTSTSSSESDADLCYSKVAALINNFTASQGELPGKVQLEWNLGVGEVGKLSLMRRENSKNRHSEWESLEITDPKMHEYLDQTALAGHAYEYKLQTTYFCRDIEIVDSAVVRGWGSFRSSISGYITMPNGTAIANEPVKLTRVKPVFIDDVMDEDSVIILYGYHDGVIAEVRPGQRRIGEVVSADTLYKAQVLTNERGYFEFNDLPFMGDGTEYELAFNANYRNGGIESATKSFTLSNDRPEILNQKFICSEVASFSGNVVYSESTVPVMDAHFVIEYKDAEGNILSSCILRDSKGDPIRSDANGAFSFTVPAGKIMSVRAAKEGHQFSGNGCILVDNKDVFTPKAGEKYVISQLNDATRIRLVGRLCGGNVEGRKELGFSKSKNNLGDDLTIELQLEGNNTSWLVFHNDKPDDTTIKKTVKHPVKQLTYQPETNVTYEKKRIIIHPDVNTGEFFVDLIPTKYRVSQLTAMGYPTLYQKGEGLQILDLNDSTQVRTVVSKNDEALKYDCHANYVRIYHVTPTLTYNQFKNGQLTGYLGEKTVSRNDLIKGEKVDYTINSYDSKTEKAHYAFGYPIFDSERSYQLQAFAHEDFYYNNNKLGEVDEVPLDSGVLHVQNGLLGNNEKKTYQLDSNGRTNFVFTVGRPIFGLTGEKALLSMNMAVELDGLYIEAEPLKAFVIGHREVGENSIPVFEANRELLNLDILRDPPGKNSYAYRDKGTTYNWDKSSLKQTSYDLKIDLGYGNSLKQNAGAGWIVETHVNVFEMQIMLAGSMNIPLVRSNDLESGSYSMTLGERIQTSSDELDVGAMSDVYIGNQYVDNVHTTEAYTVINEDEYKLAKTNIENGVTKLISSGKDPDGNNCYLIVNNFFVIKTDTVRNYIYTQKHILGTIIPELERQRDLLLMDSIEGKTDDAYKEIAKNLERACFVRDDSAENGYRIIYPENTQGKTYPDLVGNCNKAIQMWKDLIEMNEKEKVELMETEPLKRYSIAGTKVAYEEGSSYYYTQMKWTGNKHVSGSLGVSSKGGGGDEQKDRNVTEKPNNNVQVDGQQGAGENANGGAAQNQPAGNAGGGANAGGAANAGDAAKPPLNNKINAFGLLFQLGISASFAEPSSGSSNVSKTNSTGYGFEITTNDNGYMDVDVYSKVDSASLKTYDHLSFIQEEKKDQEGGGKEYKAEAVPHSFAFKVKGGAARNPWYEPDTTLFYKDKEGKHVALGARLLKIDSPRIYVDHPVVNNQPEDESATVRIRLVNESEINDKTQYLNASVFKLQYDDKTNPNGAEIMLDGQSLAVPKEIRLAPGQSMEKTLKINRGVGYDFENMRLIFRDNANSLKDVADISIHYQPVASPISIAAPEDKWTLNTLSPQDEKGYYIPVSIDGFNVNSDGFHHLELQYKKKTDGESKWTCVCAYYNDSTLYRLATGTKEMIPASGRITDLKFYGEKDPIEMEYDLRAVAFRKLGTGFITRASSVASGKKDTSCPRVFGTNKPANGILTYADVISIPFNEPIAYNYLDKIANFQVMGRTNNSENLYSTALFYPRSVMFPTGNGYAEPEYRDSIKAFYSEVGDVPRSKVKLSLDGNDFTFDMMVKLGEKPRGGINLLRIMDKDMATENDGQTQPIKDNYIVLSLLSDKSLMFGCNGVSFTSEPMPDVDFSKFQRVGITFQHEPQEGESQVKFYVNGVEKELRSLHYNGQNYNEAGDLADPDHRIFCRGYGHINIGENISSGSITDVRLWSRALPAYEISQKRNQYVSANELGLVGYWPMDEGSGNVAHDIINGADLYFTRQSWQNTEPQFSLSLNKEQVELKAEEIERPQSYDYTLSMWVRADQLDKNATNIFSTGDKASQYFRLGTQDGFLTVNTITKEYGEFVHQIVPVESLADGAWHHVAVVGNKTQNSAATYFDGNMKKSFAGTDLGGISNFNIFLGDEKFTGNVDNLQLWDHAFPINSIQLLQKRSASGYEMGLLLNLPFEQTLFNEQGSPYTAFSPLNTVYRKKDSSNTYLPLDTAMVVTDANKDAVNCSPAHSMLGEKNIDFDWTSTNNELQLHLLASDSELNHQNVSVVVRAVEDLSGNAMQNPMRMTLYVDKNVLVWKEKYVTLRTKYGSGLTQKIKFENLSGQELNYNLYEFCQWMTMNKTEGYLSPLAESDVELTVSDDLAPGEYHSCIYLRDENDLYSQVLITLYVDAEEPEWQVTTDPSYNQIMNITGQVYVTNEGGEKFIDTDQRDIVYAFYEGVCIGKANVTVQNGEAFVFLTVHGKQSMNLDVENRRAAALIDFRLWRASTGNVTYLSGRYTNDEGKEITAVRFANNTLVGTHSSPVKFEENGNALQTFNLKKGWNWISLNVRPYFNEGVNGLFESTAPFSAGDIVNTMGGQEPSYMQTDGHWSAGKDGLKFTASNVYQVYVQKDTKASIIGTEFDDSNRMVVIKKTGWNNLAYLRKKDLPVSFAMADYIASGMAKDRSVIMSRTQFAQMEGGKWYGSLEYMHPGQGYYLYHIGEVGENGITIHYYDDNANNGNEETTITRKSRGVKKNDEVSVSESRNYLTSMGVVATTAEDADMQDGDVLVAYADDEEIGRAEVKVLDDGRRRFFISLSAADGSVVTWAQERDGETLSKVRSHVRYNGTTVAGTISDPLVIDFRKGLDSSDNVIYYTADGIMVGDSKKQNHRVLIGNDGSKVVK